MYRINGTCDKCRHDPVCSKKDELSDIVKQIEKFDNDNRGFTVEVRCGHFDPSLPNSGINYRTVTEGGGDRDG